jgi:hypothetical protein
MAMTDWSEHAQGLVPAIPAYQSLVGLEGVNPSLKQGMASLGYRLKNGESAVITIPITNADDIGYVIQYIHQMRIDALMGYVRSGWMNGPRMGDLSDLVVWTRATPQYTRLRKDPNISAQHVALNHQTGTLKKPLTANGRILRTLICQQSDEMTRFFDVLTGHIKPFIFLVDATPFGTRGRIQELLDHITGYFPSCPVVVLTAIGDLGTEKEIKTLQFNAAHWRQHPRDPVPVVADSIPTKNALTLVEIPDRRLDNRLIHVLTLTREFRDLIKNHPQLQQPVLTPLNRVIAGLRSLSIPLDFYESQLDKGRHGGLFPVRPMADWLTYCRQERLPTGESQALRDKIADGLDEIMGMVSAGETGKSQALKHWIGTSCSLKTRNLIITTSEREARFMRDWLIHDYPAEFDKGLLTIVGISSVRESYRALSGIYDKALVTGQLWETERWAFHLAKETLWLGYTSECEWFSKLGRQYIGVMNPHPEHKMDWWELSASPYRPIPYCEEDIPREMWSQCSGQYQHVKNLTFDIHQDAGWIAKLIAEFEEAPTRLKDNRPPEADEVTIVTLGGLPYRFAMSERVDRLSSDENEGLERVQARDIEVGDNLVLVNSDDRMNFTLLEILIEYAVDNTTEYKVYQSQIDRWFNYIDHALHQCGSPEMLQLNLKEAGIPIGLETVRRWGNHLVFNPHSKKRLVPIMAKIGKSQPTQGDMNAVIQAQSRMHGLHSAMGRMVKQLAVASKTGSSQSGFASQVLDKDLLADLITVEEVVSVHHHGEVSTVTQEKQDVNSVLKQVIELSEGRLSATQAAFKSADDSPFRDIEKIRQCLTVLADDYYRVYHKDKSIQLAQAIDAGRPYQIQFKGDTAASTKGLYGIYKRDYKGSRVDIGKHLGIGNTGNPERCFRLHFHWDNDAQQIVIHHAGRHLPTSTG